MATNVSDQAHELTLVSLAYLQKYLDFTCRLVSYFCGHRTCSTFAWPFSADYKCAPVETIIISRGSCAKQLFLQPVLLNIHVGRRGGAIHRQWHSHHVLLRREAKHCCKAII